jgi:hypothetical protein
VPSAPERQALNPSLVIRSRPGPKINDNAGFEVIIDYSSIMIENRPESVGTVRSMGDPSYLSRKHLTVVASD